MPQDSDEAGESGGRDLAIPRISRLRRTLVLVLVSLGVVSGGTVIGATAAGAASGSSESATVQDSSSDASTTQAQEDQADGDSRRDCPEKTEAGESA